MILADKIIRLRKKNGWSQEELADKMNVSRQAVSKWEAAQSTPDLEKILRLSSLFGVTTDYLLKDEMENEEFTDGADEAPVQKITLAQAHEYMDLRKEASVKIAVATFLCIIGVIPLLLLGALSELNILPIGEETASVTGVAAILLIAAVAVYMYIRVGFKSAPYAFLEKEPFEAEYGVAGLVKDRQMAYRKTYAKYNYTGVCICILSPIPLLCGVFSNNDLMGVILLCVTLIAAACGVALFIIAGVRWASMQKLLGEGEFSERGKQKSRLTDAIGSVYWLVAVAVYLGWSFLSGDWHITWVIWPIAGVLFGAVDVICGIMIGKRNKQ